MFNEFQPFGLSPSQILRGGDSLKEELHRTDETENVISSQSSWRNQYPTAVNWEVPTSKKKEATQEEFQTLYSFWDHFLSVYSEKLKEGLIKEVRTARKEHRDDAFQLLWEYKDKIQNNPLDKEELLKELEVKIERSSMMFDEQSIFNNSGMLINKLVRGKYKQASPPNICIFENDISVSDVTVTNNMNVEEVKQKVNAEYTDEELINVPNAKEYVKCRLKSKQDISVLNALGHYTLECIIVYVLGILCNNPANEMSHMVRLATLIDKLDTTVRSHAEIELQRNDTLQYRKLSSVDAPQEDPEIRESEEDSLDSKKRKKGRSKNRVSNGSSNTNHSKMSEIQQKYECTNYGIGVALFEFLLDKGLVTVKNQNNENHTGHILIKTKRSRYYKPMPLYVSLTFDRNLLPVKLSLPMVCRPLPVDVDESHGDRINVEQPSYFLRGGYLLNVSKDIIEGARLLSTPNVYYYDVRFQNVTQARELASVMNALQEVPFRINHPWLKTIISDYDLLVKAGLLLPKELATMELISACDILRGAYLKNARIQELYSYNDLLRTLTRNIQRARYEGFIIELAEVLDGYQIYFPVYLDFRGRNYRAGISNFHERDFAKALLLFVPDCGHTNDTSRIKGELAGLTSEEVETIHIATGFHIKKFLNYEAASKWYSDHKEIISEKLVSNKLVFYHAASRARHPFQFLANITILHSVQWKDWMAGIPIHKDASASAYQIMSYLLLDKEMAIQTNLISDSKEHKIYDIYELFKSQLLRYARNVDLNDNVNQILSDHLNRSLVKSVFMPMIYGKTVMSTAADIYTQLTRYITYKESFEIAKLCFSFWREKYSHMENLITLIRLISWVVATANQPVWLSTKYLYTIQDYICLKSNDIWVHYFDKMKMKKSRKKVTMKVFTNKRDRRKTVISTFVNFIHQRDASIAMDMVQSSCKRDSKPIPLYTVHDNFITTAKHCEYLPSMYSQIFIDMGAPIIHINKFIYDNIILPVNKVLEPEKKIDFYKLYFNETGYPLAYSEDTLERYLTEYMRIFLKEDGSKLEKELWKNKNKDIANRYKSYVETVYSYNPVTGIKNKWFPFAAELNNGSDYCLHL